MNIKITKFILIVLSNMLSGGLCVWLINNNVPGVGYILVLLFVIKMLDSIIGSIKETE